MSFFWVLKNLIAGSIGLSGKLSSLTLSLVALALVVSCQRTLGYLGKWKWRFLTEDKALWNIVIKEFYGADGGFNSAVNHIGAGGIWPDIINVVKGIDQIDAGFKSSFVRKVVSVVWSWSWRIPSRRRANNNLETLTSYVGSLNLSVEGRDEWKWSMDISGSFKVYTLSRRIQNLLFADHSVGNQHLWNSWIPWKVNICVWRASLNRLPTRANLASRGVDLDFANYPFCDNITKDLDHCVIKCPIVLPIWRKAIWKWRNRIVNAPADTTPKIKEEEIFPSIQRLSRTWIAARNSYSWQALGFLGFVQFWFLVLPLLQGSAINRVLRTLIPFRGRFLVRGGFVTSVSLLPGRASARLGLVLAHHILAASICLIGPGAHCDNMVQAQRPGSATLSCSLCLPQSSVLPRPLHVWVDEAWLTWSVCGLSSSD
ncbi:RNA-directed DNA polymerase, eukaryota, reverse transcriptase zinc-binding domain protein [Tanacetum coccineum]